MTLHKNIPLGARHKSYNYEYADATARLAATGFTVENVGDMSRQIDNNSIWMLTDHSPITWVQQGAGSGTPILADGTVPFAANESMGSNKLTDVANGTLSGDAVNYSQLSSATGDISTLAGRVTTNEGDIDDLEDYAGVNPRSGFPNLLTDATVAFNETSRLFSITPTGATFEVWSDNVKYLNAADSITLANSQGEHWVYYDAGGTLVETVNPSDAVAENILKTLGLVTIIYYDATNAHRIWRGDERHGTAMSGATHYHFHESFGAFLESGAGPISIVSDGDGSLAAHAQFGVGAGELHDEDVEHTLAAHGSTANWHVLYKSGAAGYWVRKDPKDAFPIVTAGTGRMAWNEFTGGAWQLTEHGNGDFGMAHLYATNDPDDYYVVVVGQGTYGNVSAARVAASTELSTINTEGLPTPEAVWVATFIFETKDGYANAVKARIRTVEVGGDDFIDWREQKLNGAASSTADHGSLSGLADPDHPLEALVLPQGTSGVTTMINAERWFSLLWNSGGMSGFALTDNLDGTVDIAAGEALLRTADTEISPLVAVAIPAQAGLTLINDSVSFINIRWNGGAPDIAVSSTEGSTYSEVGIYLCVRHGSTIHYIDTSAGTKNAISKNIYKDVGVYGFEHVKGGTVVTETGTMNFYVASGIFYLGTVRLAHGAFDTSGTDTFVYVYSDGGTGWTRVTSQTDIDNAYYDDGTGTLNTVGSNKFGVHFVYMLNNNPRSLIVMYGKNEYASLAEAQQVSEPLEANRPPELQNVSTGELIAKIISQEGQTTFSDIQQPWEDFFASTGGVTPSTAGVEAVTISNTVTSGTDGGGATGAAWNKRVLNTLSNPKSYTWVTFDDANDRFTLIAGYYHISAKAQCYAAGDHQLRLRADPAGTPATELAGHAQQCPYWNEEASQTAELDGVFEITGTETYQIEHYIEQTVATYGQGKAVNSGESEIFCSIQIAKLES